ncbi:MAG: hypothetical protein V3V60_17265 [Sphingomonas aquatilis]|jgi:hypothetical protein|uniref:hypothetical protein n=1 Tax=Sphingomonas aquatilis TaxID=93063 RepID=UPI002F2CC7D8
MSAITLSHAFSSLLTRYRREITDLDAAQDQDEIDELADLSEETLTKLVATRPRSAAGMADKVDAIIQRYDDAGTVPIEHVRQLLLDAHHLSTDVDMVLAWVNQWHDLGGTLMIGADGERIVGLPEPLVIGDARTGPRPPHLQIRTQDEAMGAAKTLQAMLKLAGQRMVDGVFAFAHVAQEG